MRLLPKRDLSSEVWKMAGPVVIGMISQTFLNLMDTAMVGRLGAVSLAAAGLAGTLSWTILGAVGALNIGVQAVAARRFGEKEYSKAGRCLDNSIAIALLVGVIVMTLVSRLIRENFGLFTDDASVVSQGRDYVFYRLMGAIPFMIIMAHRGFFNGVGKTKFHMSVAIVINVVNVLANYLLIFGKMGFPAMGTGGAGLASTIGTTVGMVMFVIIGLRYPRRESFHYYKRGNLDRDVARGIVKLSAASGMRMFLAMLGFSVFSGIVARIGTVEMAATNVVLTIISMSFLPGAGFGTAAASLIGQQLGEGRPDKAEEYAWESTRLGMLTMGGLGLIFILFPDVLLRFFTTDASVIAVGTMPLRMMGFVQICDAIGMVLMGALEGAGLNTFVMFAEIMVNWLVFLPCTYLFAHVLGWGLLGAWASMVVYLVLLGVILVIKFMRGSWKTVEI